MVEIDQRSLWNHTPYPRSNPFGHRTWKHVDHLRFSLGQDELELEDVLFERGGKLGGRAHKKRINVWCFCDCSGTKYNGNWSYSALAIF